MIKTFIVKYKSAIKTIFLGICLTIIGFYFWFHIVGNILDELRLISRAQVTNGFLVETTEIETEGPQDKINISERGIYAFHLPNGEEYKSYSDVATEKQVEIEYLSDDPWVNRVKGDGCQSVIEWIWRKVGLGSLFLVMVLSPGCLVIKNGVRELKKEYQLNNKNI